MIRLANLNDVEEINQILLNAREFMHSNGNPNQWNGIYPDKDDILEHVEKHDLYVIEIDSKIQFAFVYSTIKDGNYDVIEGKWLNDEPYGVFHLVMSRFEVPHLGDEMIKFGKEKIDNLRIDTHVDNIPMRRLLQRNNFKYTGIIYVEDGTPRNAYHWCRNLE